MFVVVVVVAVAVAVAVAVVLLQLVLQASKTYPSPHRKVREAHPKNV